MEVVVTKHLEVKFTFDHVHIKCHDIDKVKKFYKEMFNAVVVYEGKIRDAPMVMMKLGDAFINISEASENEVLESRDEPRGKIWIRYGIGHFGVCVKDLDMAVRILKEKGGEFICEPREVREGVRVAFIKGPEDDVIEIVQRD